MSPLSAPRLAPTRGAIGGLGGNGLGILPSAIILRPSFSLRLYSAAETLCGADNGLAASAGFPLGADNPSLEADIACGERL